MLLGGRPRLQVVLCLVEGPRHVDSIAAEIGVRASYISRALGELMDAGIVEMRVEKKLHVYRLSADVKIDERAGVTGLVIPTEDDYDLIIRDCDEEDDPAHRRPGGETSRRPGRDYEAGSDDGAKSRRQDVRSRTTR